MTPVAGSPCAKTVSFARKLVTVLPRPAESRNDFASKPRPFAGAFLGERRTFTGARRVVDDTITRILRFLLAVQYCTLARLALFESSHDVALNRAALPRETHGFWNNSARRLLSSSIARRSSATPAVPLLTSRESTSDASALPSWVARRTRSSVSSERTVAVSR